MYTLDVEVEDIGMDFRVNLVLEVNTSRTTTLTQNVGIVRGAHGQA